VTAPALGLHVTNQSLAETTAASYSFLEAVWERARSISDATALLTTRWQTVLDVPLTTNGRSRNRDLYCLDGHVNDSLETSFRKLANEVFSAINEAGDI
jgi:hypothetical protein